MSGYTFRENLSKNQLNRLKRVKSPERRNDVITLDSVSFGSVVS